MTINQRIEFILKDKKLTANDFASKLGVRASNISHIVTGRNKPSFAFIEKLSVEFPEINPLWLLKGEGKMYIQKNITEEISKPAENKDVKADNTQKTIIINATQKDKNVPLQKNLFGDEEPLESNLLKSKKNTSATKNSFK